VQSYTYDAVNRLSLAIEKLNSVMQWQQGFSYDVYGNRSFDVASTIANLTCFVSAGESISFLLLQSGIIKRPASFYYGMVGSGSMTAHFAPVLSGPKPHNWRLPHSCFAGIQAAPHPGTPIVELHRREK
jgi:hypothetical protein